MTAPRTDDPHWNSWAFWKAALKGNRPNVPLGIVSIGYYRKQNRTTGEWFAAAVWIQEDGVKSARIGQSEVYRFETAEAEEDFDTNTFQYVSKYPVTYKDYQHWMEHRQWPEALGLNVPKPREAMPGDNSGANEAETKALAAEAFADQVTSALGGLSTFANLSTKELAEQAQGLRSRLASLAGEGDKAREAEKKPHLEAGRRVDEAWNPNIRKAREGAGTLKTRIDTYMADQARKAREAAIVQAAAGNAPTEKPEPVVLKSSQGRSTRARDIITTRIVDQDLVYQQFKGNGEVIVLLAKLVQRVADNGGPQMKGVEYGKSTVAT